MTEISKDRMELLYEERKELVEPIEWDQLPNRGYTMDAKVEAIESEEIMTVRGELWGKAYSFYLHYHNNIVRLWDFNDHHEFEGHKHEYIEDGQYGEPYEVQHIPTDDVNEALNEFLDECNIEYDGVGIHRLTGLDHYV